MPATSSLRARRTEETRQLLVDAGRDLFTEQGYAATSTEMIIRRAGVARGALYHHFTGKEALFQAVYDEVQAEAITRIAQAASSGPDLWAGVRAGLSAFLDACLQPTFRRVVILDSVAVLQHASWDGDDEPVELQVLRNVVGPLVAGELQDLPVEPLAHVALGSLYGAALYLARSEDPPAARAQIETLLDTLAIGLRNGSRA